MISLVHAHFVAAILSDEGSATVILTGAGIPCAYPKKPLQLVHNMVALQRW